MILSEPRRVLGKIAVDLLAKGDGWSVEDVTCTAGPGDRPFEERHSEAAIALVVGGSFAYRSRWGRGLMTPGSWLLGNPGDHFECSHDHAAGDRCVAFHYSPDYFERLAASAGQSPFQFLRTFERVTGVTPHQFILRARLREAAARLRNGESKIIDIALGTGFGDLSNFNRAFRIEFGVVPRAYRR